MPEQRFQNVRVAGVASAVPRTVQGIAEDAVLFGEEDARRIAQSTGIASRRVAPAGMCASDLCVAAAERLLADLGWERDSVRALIFVSQTPDHTLPATACLIQGRLGLSKNCAAFDVGRSTGMSTVASGAATMKMISSTSITSMNGVTLISCTSSRSSSP